MTDIPEKDEAIEEEEAATTVASASSSGPDNSRRQYMFLELMVKILKEEKSAERWVYAQNDINRCPWEHFFSLLNALLQGDDHTKQHFLVVKGILVILMKRIFEEIDFIQNAENCFSPQIFQPQPYFLQGLVQLLLSLVKIPTIRDKFKRDNLAYRALHAFLRLRGLILQQSQLTEACAELLLQVVKTVFSGSDDDKRLTIKAYVEAFVQCSKDNRTSIFILEQLCGIIKPIKPPRDCLVILKKASTQEDFIRGSMKKNPYCSSGFKGGTMNDIKNKICEDLGLVDSANMFELLVANRIINLDLPIIRVYDKVWTIFLSLYLSFPQRRTRRRTSQQAKKNETRTKQERNKN